MGASNALQLGKGECEACGSKEPSGWWWRSRLRRESGKATRQILDVSRAWGWPGLCVAAGLGVGHERQLEAGWQGLYLVAANTGEEKNPRRYPGFCPEGQGKRQGGQRGGLGCREPQGPLERALN